MPLPQTAEQLLQTTIFADLEQGRPNYDKPHTIGVVQKVRDLITHNPDLTLDEQILIIVAYAHDWGYAQLFHGQVADFEAVKNAKKEHMVISSQKITSLLNDPVFSFLTDTQKAHIIHIVSIHDDLDALHDTDELVFMEADTLGALDIHYVTPTFDKESNEQYMHGPLQKRLKMFITDYGKQEARRLVEERVAYYSKL